MLDMRFFQSKRTRLLPGLTLLLASWIAAPAAPAAAQSLQDFEAKTTVHVLPNGWTFILVRRPEAPVFSFETLVDAGSAQEVTGITGLAHMFEHMAFKGTHDIGTRNYPAEQKAIDALEAAYQAYQAERLSAHPDEKKVQALFAEFRKRNAEADQYVVKNEFDDILSGAGGVGLNAFTAADETGYFYSLPANKAELFAYLESDRFAQPVFREFYKERDVVLEERRLRTESQPVGRLIEQLVTTAFIAHPYQHPTIGWSSDLHAFTLTDAKRFFDRYYVPANLVTVVVGDLDPKTLVPLLDEYFERIPARPRPEALRTVEPPQVAERTVVLEDPSQPFYVEAYHRPAASDPDHQVYEAIDDILTYGRSSRLYRALVRDQKTAIQVQSFSGFPGEKYPTLWAVLAVPAVGSSDEKVQAGLRTELERLKREDVSDEELARFKTRARADLVRSLRTNSGIASQFAEAQRLYGDWREVFRNLDRIARVSKADIRRVANRTFEKTNRTVAMIVTGPDGKAPAARPAQSGR
jgi:predicted Zn-dependent peptidase